MKMRVVAVFAAFLILLPRGIAQKIDAYFSPRGGYMVLDGAVVITGSFNFSKAAEESNAENLLVIRDRELAAKYLKNWQEHAGHARAYQRKN